MRLRIYKSDKLFRKPTEDDLLLEFNSESVPRIGESFIYKSSSYTVRNVIYNKDDGVIYIFVRVQRY